MYCFVAYSGLKCFFLFCSVYINMYTHRYNYSVFHSKVLLELDWARNKFLYKLVFIMEVLKQKKIVLRVCTIVQL